MRFNLLPLAALLLCGAASAAPLKDVPAKHWASSSALSVTQKKLMTPDADGKFHGDRPVTRYELAVVLDRFVRYMEAGPQAVVTVAVRTHPDGKSHARRPCARPVPFS